MKKKIRRSIAVLLSTVLLGGVLTTGVTALESHSVPYNTYEYNYADESVSAPVGYTVDTVLYAADLGLESGSVLQDIYCIDDGRIFLLDSGNGAVYVYNKDLVQINKLDNFTAPDGSSLDIVGAQGITYHNDKLYIADTENQRVLRVGMDGVADLVIGKPDTAVLDEKTACNFIKVIVDPQNRIYAIANDVNIGALVFDRDGKFLTLFGSTNVQTTAEVILKYIRRKFMSEEQRKNDYSYTPITLTSFDIDKNGFIYTVAKSSDYSDIKGKVRSLNALGSDIYNSAMFGDIEWDRLKSNSGTQFIDVDVADDESLVLLDSSRSRVFVYSKDNDLIAVFGGYGEQKGNFLQPSAVETVSENIYVIDALTNTLQIFEPNDYINAIKTANLQMENGDYSAAIDSWKKVIVYNTNSTQAYIGIGNCYDYLGEYELAMESFKKGYANHEYSVSFDEYRKEYSKDHFVLILLIVLVALAVLIVLAIKVSKMLRPVKGSAFCPLETKKYLPVYMLFHPSSGAEQIRPRGFASPLKAAIIVVVWFFAVTLSYFFTGFSFNENRAVDFNVFYTLLQTIGIFLIFVISNYGLASFMTGKGKFKEIVTVTAYSLTPYIVSILINTALSNILTQDESMFMSIVTIIGLLWTAFMLFAGLMTIHQYSVGKTVLSFFVTLVGMLVIIFLGVLFITLYAQVLSFIDSIVREVSIRQ